MKLKPFTDRTELSPSTGLPEAARDPVLENILLGTRAGIWADIRLLIKFSNQKLHMRAALARCMSPSAF